MLPPNFPKMATEIGGAAPAGVLSKNGGQSDYGSEGVEEKEKPDQPSDGSALRDASLTGSVHRYEAALPTGYRLR
jgi:hypothetical protein